MEIVAPSAGDVNSGVENCPGEKNKEKLIQLFNKTGFVSEADNLFHKIKSGALNV